MDYSLLLGIHDVARGNSENIRGNTLSVYQPKVQLQRVPSKKAKEFEPPPLKRLATNLPNEEFLERKLGLFTSEDGGLFATNNQDEFTGDYIYYFGVIDLLTTVHDLEILADDVVRSEKTSRDFLQELLVPKGRTFGGTARSIWRPVRQIYSCQCSNEGRHGPTTKR